MQIDTNLLKNIAKEGAKALGLILFLTGFGIVLNWVLLAFLIPELKSLFDTSGGMGGHGGGGAAIFLVILILIVNWKASLLFISFFLVFPVLHFLFAKKYAISKAILSLLAERKTQLVEYLLQKFFDKLNSNIDWLEKLRGSGLVNAVNVYLPIYLKKLEGIPFVIRIIAKFFLAKFDFIGIVSSIISEEGKMDISQEILIQKISSKVNLVLNEKVFSSSFQANWILYSTNLLAFTAVKILV